MLLQAFQALQALQAFQLMVSRQSLLGELATQTMQQLWRILVAGFEIAVKSIQGIVRGASSVLLSAVAGLTLVAAMCSYAALLLCH